MNKDLKVVVTTIVYYDGVQAYTDYRALWWDMTGKYKLTTTSKKALMNDLNNSGVELLKIDMNGQQFDGAIDFLENVDNNSFYLDKEYDAVENIKNKFIEYFVKD